LPLQCPDGEVHAWRSWLSQRHAERISEQDDDVVKAIEPEMGYGAIMQVSQTEAKMREERIKKTKTVCTYCGVGCSYDVWTKDRKILKIEPLHGHANQISLVSRASSGGIM